MKDKYSIQLVKENGNFILKAYSRRYNKMIQMDLSKEIFSSLSLDEILGCFSSMGKTLEDHNISIEEKNNGTERFAISSKDGMIYLHPQDVLYFEAERSYTTIYMQSGKKYVVSNRSLSEFESMLENEGFVRIHRSYLVNQNYVTKYHRNGSNYLLMKNEIQIPVARRKRTHYEAFLKDYLSYS
jgi:two-component system LytT family response regulator